MSYLLYNNLFLFDILISKLDGLVRISTFGGDYVYGEYILITGFIILYG